MSRRQLLPLLFVPLVLVAGCGGPTTGKVSGGHGRRVAPLLAQLPPAPSTLRPVATSTTLGSQGITSLTADLTGQGEDTISVRTTPDGDGQVTVTASQGVIFQKQHVSGASVLLFGKAHLPVLLLQDSFNLCGSGGCGTTAYTWSPSRLAMLPVPSPTAPAYRYIPAQRQFTMTQVPQLGSLFGFVVPGGTGIVENARTYDTWQHDMAQSYAYAPSASPTGGWEPVGPVRYAPSGRESGVSFSDPGQALLAVLTARSLGFRPQLAQVSASGSAVAGLWRDLAPLAGWQGSLFAILPAPVVHLTGSSATASDRITGLVGQGPSARLEAYEVTGLLERAGSAYFVTSAHLAPLNVRVRSALDVLARIRSDPSLLKSLQHYGNPPLLITAVGQQWQVSLAGVGSMQDQPWLEIDALSGRLRRTS